MALQGETQVLVVGAGPVGQFAALALAQRGAKVEVLDEQWRGSVHSYALALHPSSLALLDEVGAAEELIRAGERIDRVAFYRGRDRAGEIDFSRLGGRYPFVLVVPQSALEQALEQRLRQAKVRVWWNHQALAIEQDAAHVAARVGRREKYSMGYPVATTEWMITKESDVRAAYLVGADGFHSFVRRTLGTTFEQRGQVEAFAVYEFPAHIDFAHEARVVFHEGTINVVWPLHDRRGRFSFQVDPNAPPAPSVDALKALVRARVPWFEPAIEEVYWTTNAVFERRLVERFGRGRIWLAGDAAHLTGPVGAQSMNVGLREARDLAARIAAALSGGDAGQLESYQDERVAEWKALLGGARAVAAQLPAWLADVKDRIPACVPASGDDLRALLGQLGLALG